MVEFVCSSLVGRDLGWQMKSDGFRLARGNLSSLRFQNKHHVASEGLSLLVGGLQWQHRTLHVSENEFFWPCSCVHE